MKPNFLIFMSDQEQFAVLEENDICITPNTDAFAQSATRFQNAYCPTAHCCPSRATFMTGLYPSRHGIYNNVSTPTAINRDLKNGVQTFSEMMAEDGYRLAYSGKWHVSDKRSPSDFGWDELLVTALPGAKMHTSIVEWQAKSEDLRERRYGELARPGWGNFRLFGSYQGKGEFGIEDHPDYAIVEQAIDKLLDDFTKSETPWCLFIGTNGPHDPFVVPEQLLDLYPLDAVELPANYDDDMLDKPNIYRRLKLLYGQLSENEMRDTRRYYLAYCTMQDMLFGKVLDALRESGQFDNTVILRTSDHGEYASAHGLFMKGVPAFDEGYHIPAIMRLPERFSPSQGEIHEFVNLADFMPTFLELAAIDIPEGLSGRSLVPLLKGTIPSNWRDAHHTQFNGVELYYTQRSVKTLDYKYVYNGFDFDELYDLREDPNETVNRAQDPKYDAIKRQMVRKMWQFAMQENDELIMNAYGTVALAPYGPLDEGK